MQIKVLLFGQLREVVGASEEEVDLSEGACSADLLAHYQQRFPQIEKLCPSVAMAVNQEYVSSSASLQAGDEVALLPPVSGGAGEVPEDPVEIVELTRTPIDTGKLKQAVQSPQDGAVLTFDGIVRNNSRGQETLYLDYEAYEPMALEKMRGIVAALRTEFPVDGIAVVHRLGRLEIGETSVFIAVSSPHRGVAFDACRKAIDTLKQSVPIWKKEYFADGETWVEGELPGPAIEGKSGNPVKKEC
jgi:molybdopterin synthase catalytic subunit